MNRVQVNHFCLQSFHHFWSAEKHALGLKEPHERGVARKVRLSVILPEAVANCTAVGACVAKDWVDEGTASSSTNCPDCPSALTHSWCWTMPTCFDMKNKTRTNLVHPFPTPWNLIALIKTSATLYGCTILWRRSWATTDCKAPHVCRFCHSAGKDRGPSERGGGATTSGASIDHFYPWFPCRETRVTTWGTHALVKTAVSCLACVLSDTSSLTPLKSPPKMFVFWRPANREDEVQNIEILSTREPLGHFLDSQVSDTRRPRFSIALPACP